jgi:hypothetical protein
MTFDPNQMHELAALSRDRYQRAGGGGAHKVYNTSKAYWDARGFKELSAFQQARIEARVRFKQLCELQKEHFRMACLTSKEGFYHGEDIPF